MPGVQDETQQSLDASQSLRRGMPDYMNSTMGRNAAQDFSFTRGAADRNEMRVLCRFIRLADLLVLNTLREVCCSALRTA